MTKQQKTALYMATFIQAQSLFLLEKLNELDLDVEAEELYCSLVARLGDASEVV
ncbi:Rop family plasmid primer RNA-binding protein [Salmonella enterica]|nr:Rop family plasmid primer RNA-binding protein [Salmonella enterica]